MFGKFVFSFLFLLSGSLYGAQKGTVTADETFVYLNPDFDAQIIATLYRGDTFDMSNKPQGPFYKVRLKDKRLGWVSSIDIKPGVVEVTEKKVERKAPPLESHTDEVNAKNNFGYQRYQGFFVQALDWKEKTLGKTRKDRLNFYGWNWTGFDTLVEGPFYIDTRVLFTFEVPDYYKKVTGFGASGWVVKAQTSFTSANPIGENFLYHYGMGLTSTFSHFEASVLKNGTRTKSSLDDLTVGAVIPIGISYRLGLFSLQAFFQYYLEKTQTTGASLGFNWRY